MRHPQPCRSSCSAHVALSPSSPWSKAPPPRAASIVLAAARREKHYYGWINACYHDDPVPAVQGAIRTRHHHHGYMADYGLARRLVQEAIAHGDPCIFASWF